MLSQTEQCSVLSEDYQTCYRVSVRSSLSRTTVYLTAVISARTKAETANIIIIILLKLLHFYSICCNVMCIHNCRVSCRDNPPSLWCSLQTGWESASTSEATARSQKRVECWLHVGATNVEVRVRLQESEREAVGDLQTDWSSICQKLQREFPNSSRRTKEAELRNKYQSFNAKDPAVRSKRSATETRGHRE